MEKPASNGRLFPFGARGSMKLSRSDLIGFACAFAAMALIAWMCLESWGGLSPF
jgi:hypothetical protein